LGEFTYYTYDLNNNMLTQKDGKGNVTTFTYNSLNKLLTKVDQGGAGIAAKTETYTYNPDGTMKTKVDRNAVTTTYIYDVHGRLTSQVAGDITTGTKGQVHCPKTQHKEYLFQIKKAGNLLNKRIPSLPLFLNYFIIFQFHWYPQNGYQFFL